LEVVDAKHSAVLMGSNLLLGNNAKNATVFSRRLRSLFHSSMDRIRNRPFRVVVLGRLTKPLYYTL